MTVYITYFKFKFTRIFGVQLFAEMLHVYETSKQQNESQLYYAITNLNNL